MKEESEAIWLEKWCPQHAVNGAVIKLSEALVAGGINESGLKQDRCEGQHGGNPERKHFYAGRWFVAGYFVRVFCERLLPGISPRCIIPRDPLPPGSCVALCVLVMPCYLVPDPSFCLQCLAPLLPGAYFLTSSVSLLLILLLLMSR